MASAESARDFSAQSAPSRDHSVRTPLTLVNTPLGVQHYPWPVYSAQRGFSNKSIVFHGAKRNTSRAWAYATSHASGPFIPLNRTCGRCREMGWVSAPARLLRAVAC